MKVFGRAGLGVAIAGALLTCAAMAQGPGGMDMGPGFGGHRPPMEKALGPQGDHGRWWNNPKVVERLKLTDDQRKAFDGIFLAHREKLIDLRASVEKAELEMEPLVSADQPDESRILSQIDKVAQARAELEKANARFLLAIRNKLTPEQWKQVQAFRASHGMERERERGGQDGRGPGNWAPGQGPRHRQGPPPPPSPQGAAPNGAPQGAASDEPPQEMAPDGPPSAPAAPGAGDEQ